MKTIAHLILICFSFLFAKDSAFAESLSKQLSPGLAIVNGCSAGLIIFEGIKKHDRALVATNGHCLLLNLNLKREFPYPMPGENLANITDTEFREKTNITLHGPNESIKVKMARLIFGTMSGTDLSLFEIENTYEHLEKEFKILPLKIANRDSSLNTPVSIVSGYYNRKFSCSLKSISDLIEGPFYTNNALSLSSECDIYPGFSGSPIVNDLSGEVIGLANTHFSNEGELCSFNNPCIIDPISEQRIAPFSGQSFGISLIELKSCFDFKLRQIDLELPTCKWSLDRGLDKIEMNNRIKRFSEFASHLISKENIKLKFELDNDWEMHLGSSILDETAFSIVVGSKVYETENLSADSFDLILCHELGHLLGAAPKKKNTTNSSPDWASSEGESDYYSGKCVKELWAEDQYGLNDRAQRAALSFFKILYSQYGRYTTEKLPPSLERKDETVVVETKIDYPTIQCRLDSTVNGIEKLSRPECWYKE
ncbi:MAG: trypsin-like peptidase domain-containing protein [Bacteriovoracaceae bacterium]|nr:trypsin-like peptidase domain-containing protein [Bacteriovoracaceae bacterium]